MSNEQTVKDVYAAFQRGDVAAIAARVADDVDWRNDRVESRECPWNGNFSGKANLPGFFKAVGEHLDISVFDVQAIAASGSLVRVDADWPLQGHVVRLDPVGYTSDSLLRPHDDHQGPEMGKQPRAAAKQDPAVRCRD